MPLPELLVITPNNSPVAQMKTGGLVSYAIHLQCRDCERTYPLEPLAACEECWAPLEVAYDYGNLWADLRREDLASRPPNMWRYRELLPLAGDPFTGHQTGFTPLVAAPRLAKALGAREIYVKNDAVNHPTLSFKDRVVAVALSKAHEFGFDTVGCSSTGNLANAVAAQAAAGGFTAYIFVPANLEPEKIVATQVYGANLVKVDGNYDQVNRLCSEIAEKFAWGIVNVNLRSYYSEGSKTVGLEIAEQLGWRLPQNIVVPMAGGSLITKIRKAFSEVQKLGWVEAAATKFFGAQATGCSPITMAAKAGVARKLIGQGRIDPRESIVLAITGNGLKTLSALDGKFEESVAIRPKLADFEERYVGDRVQVVGSR